MKHFDIVIIGGGPAGLAATLTFGRARKRVLLCDAGNPRNAVATHLHNFVTRDGTPLPDFRHLGCDQLKSYPLVEIQDVQVEAIEGCRDAFRVVTSSETVSAKRILLCTGMIDAMIDIPGFKEAWGRSIFQCPYCHGWEVRDRLWGYLATSAESLQTGFAELLQSWTDHVVVFTNAAFSTPPEIKDTFQRRGIRIDERRVTKLVENQGLLTHVAFKEGDDVRCDVLYAHPPQHHVRVVQHLGLHLDKEGYVQVDPVTKQTSNPGIYAAGDLTSRAQGAIFSAAAGTHAAAMMNHELCSL